VAGSETIDVGESWYEVVADDSLRQGDIVRDLTAIWLAPDLPVLSEESEAAKVEFARGDWIVLSASCDLDRMTPSQVLMARILPATHEILQTKDEKTRRERLEVLRRGFDPLRFLLPPHAKDPKAELSFVTYRSQVLLPIAYVRKHCTKLRLRLRSPHREKFGNWAGTNLARVGVEDAEQIRFAGKDLFIGPAKVLESVGEG
jgi:hypothetical protein